MQDDQLTLKRGITAALVYIATIGLGMYIMHHVMGGNYGDANMLKTLVWVEVVLSLICIFYIKKYSSWSAVGFGALNKKYLWWLLPSTLVMVSVWPALFGALIEQGSAVYGMIGLIAITTAMIGFSEEVMFRGIFASRRPHGEGECTERW